LDDLTNAATKEKITFNSEQFAKSRSYLMVQLKALIASDIWEQDSAFRILNAENAVIKKALDILKQPNEYNKLLTVPTATSKK
jgi:carboxyl-terminal processing protease